MNTKSHIAETLHGGASMVAPLIAMVALVAIVPTSLAVAQSRSESVSVNSITVPCTVQGYYRTDMMSRLDGYVGNVMVDIGDAVKKNDVLIELNVPEVEAEVRQKEKLVEKSLADVQAVEAQLASVNARLTALEARTNLRSSQLARILGLVNSGVLTRAKHEEANYAYESVVSERESINADTKSVEAKLVAAEAAVEVARADLDYAKVMANYVSIRAPFDGVVTARNVDPGAYVRPPTGNNAMPLIQLENIDKVRIVIMVPYVSASGVEVGNGVVISGIRGREEVKVNGTITRVGTGFEKGSRMMRAEVDLNNKPTKSGKRLLRSGDYGSATIQMSGFKGASNNAEQKRRTIQEEQSIVLSTS